VGLDQHRSGETQQRLRIGDCPDDASYQRMHAAGVEFLTEPRTGPYGRVVVFRDISGNRWDLLTPNAPS
jgi:uncharacterized glyoxalase superfamily protein PhnB